MGNDFSEMPKETPDIPAEDDFSDEVFRERPQSRERAKSDPISMEEVAARSQIENFGKNQDMARKLVVTILGGIGVVTLLYLAAGFFIPWISQEKANLLIAGADKLIVVITSALSTLLGYLLGKKAE